MRDKWDKIFEILGEKIQLGGQALVKKRGPLGTGKIFAAWGGLPQSPQENTPGPVPCMWKDWSHHWPQYHCRKITTLFMKAVAEHAKKKKNLKFRINYHMHYQYLAVLFLLFISNDLWQLWGNVYFTIDHVMTAQYSINFVCFVFDLQKVLRTLTDLITELFFFF